MMREAEWYITPSDKLVRGKKNTYISSSSRDGD